MDELLQVKNESSWYEEKIKIKYYSQISMVIWIIILIIVFKYFIPYGIVQSSSMEPTLNVGDLVVYSNIPYIFAEIERGDIIAFSKEGLGDCVSKRVIGIPGDVITFQEGVVCINNNKIDETYYLADDTNSFVFGDQQFVVPSEQYFVLGDNRMDSYDSRFWAEPFLERENIKGKMILQVPLSMFKASR